MIVPFQGNVNPNRDDPDGTTDGSGSISPTRTHDADARIGFRFEMTTALD